jgi:hypothetical protein
MDDGMPVLIPPVLTTVGLPRRPLEAAVSRTALITCASADRSAVLTAASNSSRATVSSARRSVSWVIAYVSSTVPARRTRARQWWIVAPGTCTALRTSAVRSSTTNRSGL